MRSSACQPPPPLLSHQNTFKLWVLFTESIPWSLNIILQEVCMAEICKTHWAPPSNNFHLRLITSRFTKWNDWNVFVNVSDSFREVGVIDVRSAPERLLGVVYKGSALPFELSCLTRGKTTSNIQQTRDTASLYKHYRNRSPGHIRAVRFGVIDLQFNLRILTPSTDRNMF